jgi:hypothetical protein
MEWAVEGGFALFAREAEADFSTAHEFRQRYISQAVREGRRAR